MANHTTENNDGVSLSHSLTHYSIFFYFFGFLSSWHDALYTISTGGRNVQKLRKKTLNIFQQICIRYWPSRSNGGQHRGQLSGETIGFNKYYFVWKVMSHFVDQNRKKSTKLDILFGCYICNAMEILLLIFF